MKKGRISNVLQRIFIFGSVTMLMAGLVFNGGDLVNADGTVASKVEKCALTSVTVTAGESEKSTYTGGLEPVIVGKDVNWTTYFCIRTISDVQHQESDACTAKTYFGDDGEEWTPHDHVSAYIYLPNYTGEEVINRDLDVQTKEGDSGAWAEWINGYRQNEYSNNIYYETEEKDEYEESGYRIVKHGGVKLDESVGYYDVKFQPRYGIVDGESPTGIYVRFAKQYDISYDLVGGSITGAEKVYTAGTEYTLPIPTKEGYYFVGWTSADATTPAREVVIAKDATGDITYTAHWEQQKKIFDCDITLKDGDTYTYTGAEIKPEVIIKDGEATLVEGVDYTVEYMNNVKVSAKDSPDLPTVTVMGIGKYTGVSVMYFTIESPWAEVGETHKSKDGKATYKVTESDDGEVEVTFVKPSSKKKSVTIPATVTLADGTKAEVTAIDAKAFKGNTKLETITIGKNVDAIGKEAFKGCKNLKKVKSAKNVEKIGKEAFANCKKLTSVAMSGDLESIGEKAFYKCTALKKITIPKDVEYIGKSAFQGCKKLKNITIKTTKLTKKNVKKNAFKGISSNAKIDVPNKKVKAYKSILRARGVSKKATIK